MKTSETLFILDLDRTMANTRLYDEAERALQKVLDGSYDVMKRAQQKVEASGGSFDIISYMNEQNLLAKDFLQVFAQQTNELGHEAFRNVGATRLLEQLNRNAIPYIFMTYGGEIWQRAKLVAAGYDSEPTIITDSKNKGHLIAERQTEAGQFMFDDVGISVGIRHIVLVDDKAAAFQGLPLLSSSGYLLQDASADKLPSQDGELPSHIKLISSLTDILPTRYN